MSELNLTHETQVVAEAEPRPLPNIHRESDPSRLAELNISNYVYFQKAGLAKLVYDNQGQPIGVDEGAVHLSPESLERIMAQDCDTLAGIYDATISESRNPKRSHFLEGTPRSSEPIHTAVYLDKSARPVAATMRLLWPTLSNGTLPNPYFANIDKEPYLEMMGYGKDGENLDNIPLESISLDLIDPATRRDLILRLRAMYITGEQRDKLLTDQTLSLINSGVTSNDQPHLLESVYNVPTALTGKHVAIIDEVKSSGATLKIADLLYREAFPDATIEPLYWSVPNRLYWNTGKEYANEYTPVWYDKQSAYGRGGIGGVDHQRSGQAKNVIQRVGAPFVSTAPYDNEGNRRLVDQRSHDIRHDIRLFAKRFSAGLVRYEPSNDRVEADYEQRLSNYYQPYSQ